MAVVVTSVSVAIATMEFAAICTAIAEVGIAMSVVGAVTGSKDLSKWGGYLSIAGGVGSLAAGAMGAAGSASAEVAGESLATEGLAEGAVEGALDLTGQDIATTAYSGGDMSPVFSDSAGGALDGSMSLDSINAGGLDADGITPAVGGGQDQIAAGKIDNPYLDQNGVQPTTGPQPSNDFSDARFNSTNSVDQNWTGSGSATPPPDTSSSGIADWFKKQPKSVQDAVLQGAAGAAKGVFAGWSEDQKMALEREKFNLDKTKYSTGMTNASAQPAIKFAPVGIINSKIGA